MANQKITHDIDVAAGTVAYFAADKSCSTRDVQWDITAEHGTPFAGAAVICGDAGRVVFAKGGRYEIEVYSVAGGTGPYPIITTKD